MPTPFQTGYVECALWASSDDNGTPFDHMEHELATEALAQLYADAADFETTHRALLDIANAMGRDDECLGHDFWLTRNGHGAGFWDRDMGELGDILTRFAEAYGSCDLYVGDDGLIYAN